MKPHLVLAVLLALGPPARAQLSQELHPSWSPDGDRLVFESDMYGSADVFVIQLASGEVRRLTDDSADDGRPVWSPNGEWIAFHSDRAGRYDLYVIRPDGTDLRRLTESELDETSPGWSPSSDQLVYELRRDDHWYLGTIDTGDGTARVLLDRPGDHLTPTWVDDNEIVFTYAPPGGNHDTDVVLFAVDATGRVLGPLLRGAPGNSNAHYSAMRNQLVFNSIRDGDWEIYTAARDGARTVRLTNQSQADLAGIDGQPEWSPTADRIAITSGRAGSLDIVLLNTSGDELRNLTASWSAVTR